MAADATLSVAVVAEIDEFNRKMRTVPLTVADLERRLLAYKDISKNALDPSIAAKYNLKIQETQKEITRLSNIGKTGFDAMGNAAVKSSGGFQKAYSGLRDIANILPGIGIGGLVGLALGPLLEYIQTLDLLKEKLSQIQVSQKVLSEAFSSSEYVKALKSVSELTINIDLAKKGLLNKKSVLEQYNETIGKTTGQVSSLDQAERELTKNGAAYIRITLLKAAAQIALDQAAKKAFEAAQKRNQTDNEALGVIDSYLYSNPKLAQVKKNAAARRKKEESDALIKDQKELEAIARDLQTKAAKDSAANGFIFFDEKSAKKNIKSVSDILSELKTNLKQIKNDLTLEGSESLNKSIDAYQRAIGELTKIDTKAAASNIDTLQNSIYNLKQELFKIEGNEFAAKLQKISSANIAAQDVAKLTKEIKELDDSLEQLDKQQDLELDSMVFRSGKSDLKLQTEGIKSQIDEQRSLYKQGLIDAEEFQNNYAGIIADGKILEALYELEEGIKSVLGDNIGEAFGDLGTSIGEALASGGDVLSAVGNSVIESFGQFLGQIGDLLIEYGIAAEVKGVLDKAIAIPGAGIIAGVAAIAAGTALKAAAGAFSNIGKSNSSKEGSSYKSIPQFATGVTNFSGGLAIVGEQGPELLNLPGGSDVIPNHRIASMGGNDTPINLVATVGVKMGELYVDLQREGKKRGRTI